MRSIFIVLRNVFQKSVLHMRRHSLLIPTIVSFSSFMIAVLLLLSIWFTRSVIVTLEENLYQNASFSSAKAATTLKQAFQDIVDTAAHLKEINDLSPRSWEEDTYKAYKTMKLFRSAKYSDIVFFYKNSPMLLTVHGTCYAPVFFSDVTEPQHAVDVFCSTNSVGLLSTASFDTKSDASRIFLHYPLSTQHTAVFVLNSSWMTNNISNMIGPVDGLQALFDSNGTVLWSSRPVGQDVQQLIFDYSVKLASGKKIALNNAEYIISFNDVGYGAKLVSLEKITTQFDKLNAIITMLIVVCVAILALGVLFLFFSIWRSYVPIADLVRKLRMVLPEEAEAANSDIATLRHAYSQYSSLLQESQKTAALFSSDQLRSLFVLRTISGRYTDTEELHQLCRSLQIEFPYPYFFTCLMLFDELHSEQERHALENYLHQQHSGYHSYFYILPDGNSAIAIVNMPSDKPEQLCTFGEQLISGMPESIRATVGIGQICNDITSLGKSYLEAHAALDYRLIKGKNTWITYNEIRISETVSVYPHQLIDSYVNTLRTWNVQGIREKLQQITDYIYRNNLPLQQVKCICYDLTSAFLREISTLDKHVMYKPNISYDVFNIAEYDSVSELAQKIACFSENIQQYVVKHNEHQTGDMIQQCEEYLKENVSNVQFSLSSCAERFAVAPQTLRRKFKEATGQTLSSYLTFLRIQHAKELLVSSDLDINEICEQCGYLDLSSFIRLFKSETGVSPGKFRETNQLNDPIRM